MIVLHNLTKCQAMMWVDVGSTYMRLSGGMVDLTSRRFVRQ
jgi:hypothetical protein